MNKKGINHKGTQDDHSFRNVYKIELGGLLGNNYDELDEDNLTFSIKGFLLKIFVFIITATLCFFLFKEKMWSTDTRTAVVYSLGFLGSTLAICFIANSIIDGFIHKKRK